MENYHGLIIAVENYHDDKNISPVDYALNDAEQFLQSIIELGCRSENFEYLVGDRATKTAILQKIKQVSRNAQRGDTIILYYAGHGFYSSGKNLISSVDTFLNSLDSTTIEIEEVLSLLEKSQSKKIIGFLDCCHSGINFSTSERSPVREFSTDELKWQYNHAEHLIIFASCKDDEKSQGDIQRKHGVWSYFLIEALKGNVPEIYENKLLFSDSLQSYLLDNTFHRVKAITNSKKTQTPVKFGKETVEKFIVADLSEKLSETEPEIKGLHLKLESADISGSAEYYVRDLPGFKTSYKVPKVIDNYHNKWIKSIAYEEIQTELERVASMLRDKMKLKRRDIQDPLIEDGYGQIVTQDFDYVVGIEQSAQNPGEYVMTRRLENFKNSNILENIVLNEIFKETFNTLTFYLKKIEVEKIIDLIEDIDDPDNIQVDYKRSDTASCTIFLSGLDGLIKVDEDTISIIHEYEKSPIDLVLESTETYMQLIGKGFPQLLDNQIKTISS